VESVWGFDTLGKNFAPGRKAMLQGLKPDVFSTFTAQLKRLRKKSMNDGLQPVLYGNKTVGFSH
jgi:hypothetical protein